MANQEKVPLRAKIEIFVQALRMSAKVTKHERIAVGALRHGDTDQLKAFVAGEVENSINLMLMVMADDLEEQLKDE